LFTVTPLGSGLVGIAKLASESELLEAKRRVQYFDLTTRRFIGRASGRKMPFEWTINPYRGCEFGCKYCYARFTHEFMELRESDQFEQQIYAKGFHAGSFRAELRKIPLRDGICLGTATDPYQPAERRFEVTRQILTVFAEEAGRTLSVTTKSDLVARDVELLQRIGARNILHVFLTITTIDERLARWLEPYAPTPALRLQALKTLAESGIRVVVLSSPVLPLITDSKANLEGVAQAAAEAGAVYMLGGVLFLKPCAQKVFFPFLEERFPHLVRRYRERYERSAFLQGHYPDMVSKRIDEIRKKYGLTARPYDYHPEKLEEPAQMRLLF
jgi:DNA repair photolyase